MNEIRLTDLTKRFGEKLVIDNLNYSFLPKSKTCLMGESGCGKTTLINMLLGVLKPDIGNISDVPSRISAVFQEDRLSEPYSAVANIKAVTGDSVPDEEIIKCLRELGLKNSEYLPVSALSGGMRRRVAVARALLYESELVVLDEPFEGLDDKLRETVINVILAYTKNRTLIVVTHNSRDAELLGAEILDL